MLLQLETGVMFEQFAVADETEAVTGSRRRPAFFGMEAGQQKKKIHKIHMRLDYYLLVYV